eukprot:10923234-Heterocapsa_arctica.AAC.1
MHVGGVLRTVQRRLLHRERLRGDAGHHPLRRPRDRRDVGVPSAGSAHSPVIHLGTSTASSTWEC